jgi:HK97 gp10 family phage protein
MAGVNASMKINQRDLAQLNKKLAYLKGYDRKQLSSELAYTAAHIVRTAKKSVVVDTGNLRQSINYEANGKTISVYASAKYAPYVEFGTGGSVEFTDMSELGIPESYAAQFKGEGKREVNLPARPFFFSSVRIEYKKLLERIGKKINRNLK